MTLALILIAFALGAALGYMLRRRDPLADVDAALMRCPIAWNTPSPDDTTLTGYFADSGYYIWRATRDERGWRISRAPGPRLLAALDESAPATTQQPAWQRRLLDAITGEEVDRG